MLIHADSIDILTYYSYIIITSASAKMQAMPIGPCVATACDSLEHMGWHHLQPVTVSSFPHRMLDI